MNYQTIDYARRATKDTLTVEVNFTHLLIVCVIAGSQIGQLIANIYINTFIK